MDFSAFYQGLSPVHLLGNVNDMTFFDNEGDQAQWEGLDLEQVPNQLVSFGLGYPDPDVSNPNQTSGSMVLGSSNASNIAKPPSHLLFQPTPAPGNNFNIDASRESGEASGSAAAIQESPHTPSPKLFTCDHCGSISAKTPRDFNRHLGTKKHRKILSKNTSKGSNDKVPLEDFQSLTPGSGFRCPVSNCNDKTFPRKDNLWRHIAKMHGISDRGA